MPGGNGTGPNGAGPMTGRGAGFCTGNEALARGRGPGRGFGMGAGGGRRSGSGYGMPSDACALCNMTPHKTDAAIPSPHSKTG
jgi:hypothetical protein